MAAPRFDLTSLRPYVPTALRIAVGVIFLGHAYAKAALYTFAGTEQFFVANGFPAWTVYPVFGIELVGGIAMILGIGTRWVSLALIPVMIGAIKPHLGNGMGFSNPGGGWEFPALLVVLLAVQVVLGSGAFALDALLGRNPQRHRIIPP
jgi:putative oxidoreductase